MQNLVKPKHLSLGDTIGIVAPSSPTFEEGKLQYALRRLEELGYRYKLGAHLYDRRGELAGSDEARVFDFHQMWSDSEVNAIFSARGGTGAVRLLPLIDFDLIAKNPKIFTGFSDITGLHIPIHQRTGLVTFHGPTAGLFIENPYTFSSFMRAITVPRNIGLIDDPVEEKLKYPPPRMVISGGEARAPLTGGCLTLVKQLIGSPFEIETEGKILFLEDVREEPFSIDRMLCQLLLAGKLQKAAAIIFGESVDCTPGASGRRRMFLNNSLERVLKTRLAGLGIPVVYGLRFGHGETKCTLPLGVMARLVATEGAGFSLDIEETATS